MTKLRFALLSVIAAAGLAASLALAGNGNSPDSRACRNSVVFGSADAPQSLTFTVMRAGAQSGLHKGQVVTLPMGAPGQQVRIVAAGCLGAGGTITLQAAELHAVNASPAAKPHSHSSTTSPTTTSKTHGHGSAAH